MGMGMAEMPDTFGLIEYFITDIHTEIVGNEVRIICGVRRCGQIHWLYSTVMPAERLLVCSRACGDAAIEAFNSEQAPALAH